MCFAQAGFHLRAMPGPVVKGKTIAIRRTGYVEGREVVEGLRRRFFLFSLPPNSCALNLNILCSSEADF
jgi:hypothetical protein